MAISPASQRVREIQNLLRHVDDAQALRKNGIVAHLFAARSAREDRAAVDRVRAALMVAAKMLQNGCSGRASRIARRQYEIIMRCDLGSELHRVVARDLGLSLRQFYRERHAACERLADLLHQELTRPIEPLRQAPSEFAMRMSCAQGLRAVGQIDTALDVLRTLAAEATASSERVRVWCEIVITLCETGRITQARQALDSAWRLHYAQEYRDEDVRLMLAEIEHAGARVAWASGDLVGATAAIERVLAMLEPLDRFCERSRAIELAVWTAIAGGTLQRETGNNDAAVEALMRGRETLACTQEPLPGLRAALSISLASAHAVALGGLSMAETELAFGLDYVQRYHLQKDAVTAAALLSMIAFFRGDLDGALKHGRSALSVGRTVSGAETLAYCALNTARVEALLGRGPVGLNLIEEARSRLDRDSMMWTLTDLTEAEVLLEGGAYRRAAAIAANVAALLERFGMERYLGAALRIQADALAAVGDESGASSAIDAAIAILERRGHPFSLAQAYASSAKIARNARHNSKAKQLFALLRV